MSVYEISPSNNQDKRVFNVVNSEEVLVVDNNSDGVLNTTPYTEFTSLA